MRYNEASYRKNVDIIMIKRKMYMSRIRDNYPKYVVSLDELDMSQNGIKPRNICDFLLADEWN